MDTIVSSVSKIKNIDCRIELEINGELTQVIRKMDDLNADEFSCGEITIMEDDTISIEVYLLPGYGEPELWLQDLELKHYDGKQVQPDGRMRYHWNPEKCFRNHFGQCQFSILSDLIGDEKRLIFQPINVLARKVKANDAFYMLEYLENRIHDVVRTCFSATYSTGDVKGKGLAHPSTILMTALNIVRNLEPVIYAITRNPISRLESADRVVPASKASNIGDKSVAWLCSHPDELSLGWHSDRIQLRVRGRKYACSNMLEGKLEPNYDIYENQVMMGLLLNIRRSITKISEFYKNEYHKLEKIECDNTNDMIPIGYQRMDKLSARFGMPYYEQQLFQCQQVLNSTNRIIRIAQRIGDIRAIEGMPKYTSRFASIPNYRNLFETAREWYNVGFTGLEGDNYLFSLKTLDRLYEFYCLFRLTDTIEKLGFQLSESISRTRNDDNHRTMDPVPDFYYLFVNQTSETIELWYEPEIKRVGSDVPGLSRIQNQRKTYRPDYVMRYSNSKRQNHYAIFDAKYSTKDITLREYLPSLTFKYLHCIGSPNGGVSPVKYLWAFCTGGIDEAAGELFSNHLANIDVKPNLGVAIVSPGKKDSLAKLFTQMLENLRLY